MPLARAMQRGARASTRGQARERMATPISIFERRRLNLRRLLETRYRGNQAELARAINRAPSYVWRLLSKESDSAKHLGEDLARLIERSCGLATFWLDQEHGDLAQSVLSTASSAEVARVPRPSGPRAIPVYEPTSLNTRMSGLVVGNVLGLVYTDAELGINVFAVVMQGRAMEPDIREGDRLFFDPEIEPSPGDIVLAITGDEPRSAVVRQYRPSGDVGSGVIELAAGNTGYASVWSDRTPCQVVAVMVEHHRHRRR